MSKEQKLSTESYKGVRDFYPEDMAIQRYIFDTWSKTAESFGFERYDASVLELSELYKSKGAENEEMVNEQTYTFIDRGEREVTLRPEMTPTVARMVAGKRRELTFPLRWYSIPNLFRYERPQRGRLREHWQLNADIFGSHSSMADTEIILLASEVLKAFGARESDFEIQINNRQVYAEVLLSLAQRYDTELTDLQIREVIRLSDRVSKMPPTEFSDALTKIVGSKVKEGIAEFLQTKSISELDIPAKEKLHKVFDELNALGVKNIKLNPTLARGFDYYTGTIFEIFDTNPDNRRSLLGGGRYDNLTGLFGGDPIPAVGFGMGDVTMRDFLESHSLLPQNLQGVDIAVIPMSEEYVAPAEKIAATTRAAGKKTYVSFADKKVGEHIKQAEARHARAIIVVGEEEIASGVFALKTLADGSTTTGSIEDLLK